MGQPFFRCVHMRAGVTLHRRPWLGACLQTFVSAFASKAIRLTSTPASRASRIPGNAIVPESKVCRRSARDTSSNAKISVHNARRQDVDVNLCNSDGEALARSHHDTKNHFVDDDVQVSGFAAHMPHAKALCSNNGDVKGAETVVSSCETQSLHVSSQTLFKPRPKEVQGVLRAQKVLQAQKELADLQQKIELLESEQFSPSDARRILKARAFKPCSVEQLATALKELKKCFSCAELVRDIVVRSSNVLLQPAELVQKKLKLLRDFQVEEKVVTKLCGRGGVLSLSMESVQKKLMFFDNIGLTVAARNMMFWRAPLILRLGIEKSIQPPLKFLESKGFTKENVLKTAQHCPHIFYMSLDSLMKKYEYIKQLGFSIDKFPTALLDRSSAIIKIEEHLHTLRDLGFTDDDVQVMIQSQPAILVLSSENLKCKVEFLVSKQHRKLAEIVRFPPCLMYSLQARLIPRFNVVNDSGLFRGRSLAQILSPTDSKFVKQFRKAGDSENDSCGQQLESCGVET